MVRSMRTGVGLRGSATLVGMPINDDDFVGECKFVLTTKVILHYKGYIHLLGFLPEVSMGFKMLLSSI